MAVYPISSNPQHPDYSGKLIPQLWANKVLERFYDATVLSAISNTDYQGMIKNQGDTVHVNVVPDITIRDYAMGQNLDVERPEAKVESMLIDKGKYWNFVMDDVADVQSLIDIVPKWADNASQQLKVVVDTDCLAYLVGKAAEKNKGDQAGRVSSVYNLGTTGAPVQITKVNVLDYIVDLGNTLDEANCPEMGRKLVIPAWMAGMIKKSDLQDASLAGDSTSILRNGRLGMIDRFELFYSNLLPKSGADSYVFALTPQAFSFAAQLTKTESLRAETTFGTLTRGLMVYGRKVFYPELIAEGVVAKG